MELFFILVIVGVSIFVGTSLSAILFLLQENQELNQDINDNQPPF
jgi:Na+-transporting NADH:ubiquinone oxidoreductase subunit NqrC